MRKLTCFVTIVLLILCFASNSMAWTLVYSNDANGNATFGNIQTLINAVLEGKRVRFLVDQGVGFIWVMDAQTVWIRNNIVYVQNTSFVLTNGWQGNVLTFPADAQRFFYMADTNGIVLYSPWRAAEQTRTGPDFQANYPIKWFVD